VSGLARTGVRARDDRFARPAERSPVTGKNGPALRGFFIFVGEKTPKSWRFRIFVKKKLKFY
jgi:hypothetical protein